MTAKEYLSQLITMDNAINRKQQRLMTSSARETRIYARKGIFSFPEHRRSICVRKPLKRNW